MIDSIKKKATKFTWRPVVSSCYRLYYHIKTKDLSFFIRQIKKNTIDCITFLSVPESNALRMFLG